MGTLGSSGNRARRTACVRLLVQATGAIGVDFEITRSRSPAPQGATQNSQGCKPLDRENNRDRSPARGDTRRAKTMWRSREANDRRGAAVPRSVSPLRGSDVMGVRVPGASAPGYSWGRRSAAEECRSHAPRRCDPNRQTHHMKPFARRASQHSMRLREAGLPPPPSRGPQKRAVASRSASASGRRAPGR